MEIPTIDFLPAERQGMLKIICDNLASLASSGTNLEFLNRLIILKDIQDAWKNMHLVTVTITRTHDDPPVDDYPIDDYVAYDEDDYDGIGQENEITHSSSTTKRSIRVNQRVKIKKEKPEAVKNKFICEQCGKICSTGQKLRNHLLSVHQKPNQPEQAFICYICNKKCSRSEGLKKHMWIHTGEKRCMCSLCGKQFSRPEPLKCHVKIHTGEEPYICTWCGKRFVFGQHLKKHVRIHTGEKPFVCSYCPRGYANAETLRKHLEIHAS
jgi:uncharacterized RmlC-like cupin family protein